MEKVRDEEEATSAGGGEPAFEEGGHVMLDVVTGDDECTRLARVIEDFGLLRDEEPRWEWRWGYLFFFDRP